MITVQEFVKKILIKKGWGITKFAEEINKIRTKLGLRGKVRKQNISNILNSEKKLIGYKTALIWEKTLNLPENSLVKMVEQPSGLIAKRDFDDLKKRVKNL